MTRYRSPKMSEAWARMKWCEQMFGDYDIRWWRDRGHLFFRYESDYMLYLLRWA
jgi:hypothetical protein